MSQTKYKLPADVKILVVSLVQGYARRATEYEDRRKDIMESSPCPYETHTMTMDGKPIECREYKPHGSGRISNPTGDKAEQLLAVETHIDTIYMRAVEQAYATIASDIECQSLREKIRNAIWNSTIAPREHPYETWELPTVYRDDFHERKRKFLYEIAVILNLTDRAVKR